VQDAVLYVDIPDLHGAQLASAAAGLRDDLYERRRVSHSVDHCPALSR
jgi:hypothetical protein